MLKKILIGVVVLIVVFVVVVVTRPDNFHVARSATIAAPPEVVFAHVNDLHKWDGWSPWAKLDPNCKIVFEGPAAGTGAGYTWDGDDKVGAGHMAITESHASDRIRFSLEFLKPFKCSNTAEFTFKPEGDKTVVTWSMDGKNNFMSKAFGLFADCDKMVGGDFEKGLAQLKTVAEAPEKK